MKREKKNFLKEFIINCLATKNFIKMRKKAKIHLYYMSTKKLREQATLKFFKSEYEGYLKLPKAEQNVHITEEKIMAYRASYKKLCEYYVKLDELSTKYKLPEYHLTKEEKNELTRGFLLDINNKDLVK